MSNNIPPRKTNRKTVPNPKYKNPDDTNQPKTATPIIPTPTPTPTPTTTIKPTDSNNNGPKYVNCSDCKRVINNNFKRCSFDGRDVCDFCFNSLITKQFFDLQNPNKQIPPAASNINFFGNPPIIPTMPPTMPYQPPQHNTPRLETNPTTPNKIRLILINTKDISKDKSTNTKTTKETNTAKKHKTTDKNKNKDKDDNDDNDDEDNEDEDNEDEDNEDEDDNYNNNNDDNEHSNCCNNSASGEDDNENGIRAGNLFFESLINRLQSANNDVKNRNKNKNDNRNNSNNSNNSNKHKNNGKNADADEDEDEDEDEDDNDFLEYEWLGSNIKTIDDLIELGKSYHTRKRKRHNLNLKQLNRLVEPLIELKNMIGMQDVKKIVFDQIIYYLQQLDNKNVDMLHTVIVGPPGVGKTQLTHIIAKIYNRLGFLKTDKVICAKRDDLIGEYIGQTAPKTRKVLEKALGGVLLLDEIYSLSPTSERDFAREAIDMINMYLSEHAHDLVCVVAGYKKPTYEKFFVQNEGLARRFTHHFEIKGYSPDELVLIFKKYLEEQKWVLGATVEEIVPIVKENMEIFPNFGGDMTTLFACCKKTHSRRLLNIPTEEELKNTKKKIMIADIVDGIKLFKEIKEKHSSSEEEDKSKYMHMYT